MDNKLWVSEIFTSINGEVNLFGQGSITTFLRLSGCNLSCSWCDTPNSQQKENGKEMEHGEVVEEILKTGTKLVTITGGEPLLQTDALMGVVWNLFTKGRKIIVETNGTLVIFPRLFNLVHCWVVDWKPPSSGYYEKMNLANFTPLRVENDFVKFLVATEEDYEQMKKDVKQLRELGCLANFAVSPIVPKNILEPRSFLPFRLLSCMIEDHFFDVILNIQIHKLIGVR